MFTEEWTLHPYETGDKATDHTLSLLLVCRVSVNFKLKRTKNRNHQNKMTNVCLTRKEKRTCFFI